jgi:transcriptional regulator with PAS, ATPase and Fis domain
MRTLKVKFIAPYPGLKELINCFKNQYKQINFDVSIGDLKEGVQIAVQAEHDGYDLIVSRGGTMQMIQEAVSIPILNIDVSRYDILRAIRLAENYSGNWALVGFPNITSGAKTICNMLRNDACICTINSSDECQREIERLHTEGFSVIVGDTITNSITLKAGLNSILITSGEESIAKVFDTIMVFYRYFSTYQNKIAFYQLILGNSPSHVIVFDSDSQLVLSSGENTKELATDLVKYIPGATTNTSIQVVLPTNNGNLWKIESRQLYDKSSLIQQHIAFFCTKLKMKNLKKDSKKEAAIRIFNSSENPPVSLAAFSSNNKLMQENLQIAKKNSRHNIPLLFIGEQGTGKDSLAYAVHNNSNIKQNSMIALNCAIITDEQFNNLFNDSIKSLATLVNESHFTLYFKNIDFLKPTIQDKLLKLLNETDYFKGIKIMASSSVDLEKLVKRGKFNANLYYALPFVILHLPPLRERKEDIANLCSLFIAKSNVKYGKNIVGIEPDALELLVSYQWPRNIPQFNKILEYIILSSEGEFITLQDVENVLGKSTSSSVLPSNLKIDLNSSLDDIETNIIKYIFQEENQNLSKTANRLGISRSTLWRKLKKLS